jgi:hypothetical protein
LASCSIVLRMPALSSDAFVSIAFSLCAAIYA